MKIAHHLTDDQLRAFAQGELDLTEFELAEQHLTECDACCQRLASEPENTLLSLARAAMTFQGPQAARTTKRIAVPSDLLDHPRYKIIEPIGTGGMGAVFKAEHRLMHRTVALKLVHPWLLSNTQAVERFEREVRMAARLSHPNIVVAHDADKTDARHFLVMEYVEGETLQQRVQRDGPASIEQACDWISQAAAGLEHAREQGMTHRDIKPHNLMITRDQRVRILDFGLSRIATEPSLASAVQLPSDNHEVHYPKVNLQVEANNSADTSNWETNCCSIARTDASLILGTPDYIAPEQIDSSATVDIRADIYSLGCTLYYLLTGKPPFHAASVAETLHAHRFHDFPDVQSVRPDVPDWLASILAKMTDKRATERYSSPQEICQAIDAARAAHPINGSQAIQRDPSLAVSTSQVVAQPVAIAKAKASTRPSLGSRRTMLISIAIGVSLLFIAAIAPLWQPSKPKRFLVALPADGLWYPDYEELVKAAQKMPGRVQLVFAGTQARPSNVLSTSKPGIAVPDLLLGPEVPSESYDGMIFIGYNTQEFSPLSGPIGEQAARLVREFQMQKKVLGGLCAGQRILAQHGAARGKRIAPCVSISDEEITVEGGVRSAENVVADGLVVTATSADYAVDFLKSMMEADNR